MSLLTSSESLCIGGARFDIEVVAGAFANSDGSLSLVTWPHKCKASTTRARSVVIFEHSGGARGGAAALWAPVLSRWALALPFEHLVGSTSGAAANTSSSGGGDFRLTGTLAGLVPLSPPPPRRLWIFVNPNAGSGGSERAWAQAAPMLADAGITCVVVVTQAQGEARAAVAGATDASMRALEGILVVGGDGSMTEVVEGIMSRSDWAVCARTVFLGVLPAGSGNGLVVSLCVSAGVPFSADNAAWAVAKGGAESIDLASTFCAAEENASSGANSGEPEFTIAIVAEDGASSSFGAAKMTAASRGASAWGARHWSFLSLEWALPADLDLESEFLRCLGSARFDAYAMVRIASLRRYRGRFSYVPAPPSGSRRARSPINDDDANGPVAPLPALRHLVPFNETPPATKWKTTEGTFIFLWATNTSHQAIGISTCSTTRHDSGAWTVVLMRDMSKCSLVSTMLSLDTEGSLAKQSCVETFDVVAWRLEPEVNGVIGGTTTAVTAAAAAAAHKGPGCVALDGERLAYGPVQAEVHEKLLRVYARPPKVSN